MIHHNITFSFQDILIHTDVHSGIQLLLYNEDKHNCLMHHIVNCFGKYILYIIIELGLKFLLFAFQGFDLIHQTKCIFLMLHWKLNNQKVKIEEQLVLKKGNIYQSFLRSWKLDSTMNFVKKIQKFLWRFCLINTNLHIKYLKENV